MAETVKPRAIESAESVSQAKPVKSSIRTTLNHRFAWTSLGARPKQRQNSLPTDKLSQTRLDDTRSPGDTEVNSEQSGPIDVDSEQPPSSMIQIANQPMAESANKYIEQPSNVDVGSNQNYGRLASGPSKAPPPSSITANGEEERNRKYGVRAKLLRNGTRVVRSAFGRTRNDPKSNWPVVSSATSLAVSSSGETPHMETTSHEVETQKPAVSASEIHLASAVDDHGGKERQTPRRDLGQLAKNFFNRRTPGVVQPALLSSISDGASRPEITQRVEKDGPATVPLHSAGSQLELADAKDAEQASGESEVVEKLRQDLSRSLSQIAELQQRCEAQSKDLESSNGFLNATDKSSDSDVINALQRLNAEVQQSTTYMADCLVEDFEFHNMAKHATNEQISAVQMASETIGDVLARSLGMKPPEDIPMLLQIAFQAYLASALGQTVSSWVFEPAHNKFINAIYQSLRAVEAQAISGRWRSLARVHIVHSWVGHPDDLVRGIISGFSDIVLAAGCTAPRSDITTKVTSRFGQKIALLVELAVRLNKLFDEIISSDFEILVVRPGDKFESKDMEDTDGDRVVPDASVLCATHLGLIKRIPMGTLWERGKKQKLMVLKPKVLLESFLDAED